ncbi:MAG: hypothetical protein KDN20_12190 [Verrucomicrobiae bacterium]|nr:hypothetical protein [Verrucomicrobiae bacterium]
MIPSAPVTEIPEPRLRKWGAALLAGFIVTLTTFGCGPKQPPPPPEDVAKAEGYLGAVRDHLDAILELGRDHYGTPTPLFVDGLEVTTYDPVRWSYDDHRWILSNLANQQDLLRSLDGMSALTGDRSYREAAINALRYQFDHLKTANGLLLWGGHTCYDAESEQWVGRRFHWLGKNRTPVHELKSCYPYYELMWEVDPDATAQLIRTFWAAHIRDWSNLDFDRHGSVVRPKPPGREVWDEKFNEDAEVYFRSAGRTFVNTGSDLYYSAGMLYHLDRDKGALAWARRIAGRYVAARNPKTGLRGYQFSNVEEVDRAFEQFGDVFPDSLVNEATIFDPNALPKPELALMRLSETLGIDGEIFRKWAIEDLIAIGRQAYDPEKGTFKTLLTDGSDLTAVEMPRDGYFGPKGTRFATWASEDYLLCYATAARLDSDPFLWEMARNVARDAGLGDIGNRDGTEMALAPEPTTDFPTHLMALLELYRQTGHRAYLDQACQVGDNILRNRFENRLFTPGPGFKFTRTSRPEPLALLHLAAALLRQPDKIPTYTDGHAYFACELKSTDPNYTFDHNVIYIQRRE